MVKMGNHGNRDAFGEIAEHRAKHRKRRMLAAAWPRLEDHGQPFRLGRAGIGAHVFPAKADEPAHRIAPGERGLQNLSEGRAGHLNLATISMMPGIVFSCSAWVGSKYCTSERCERPPRMVK